MTSAKKYEVDILVDVHAAAIVKEKQNQSHFPLAQGIYTESSKAYYFDLVEGDVVSFNVLVGYIPGLILPYGDGARSQVGSLPASEVEPVIPITSFKARFFKSSTLQEKTSPFDVFAHTTVFNPIACYESLYFGKVHSAYEAHFDGSGDLTIKNPGRYTVVYTVHAKFESMDRIYKTDPEWIVAAA